MAPHRLPFPIPSSFNPSDRQKTTTCEINNLTLMSLSKDIHRVQSCQDGKGRSYSMGALPVLRRKLSNRSTKAIKWFENRFRANKSAKKSEDLWGTSHESFDSENNRLTSRNTSFSDNVFPDGYVPLSTTIHKLQRQALEEEATNMCPGPSNYSFPDIPLHASVDLYRPLIAADREKRAERRKLGIGHSPLSAETHRSSFVESASASATWEPHYEVNRLRSYWPELVEGLNEPGPPPNVPLPELPPESRDNIIPRPGESHLNKALKSLYSKDNASSRFFTFPRMRSPRKSLGEDLYYQRT
ncbi:hypothetical protein O181_026557 [Austropuccinia psidii MF-1]|uniref:Uncharacterized protein n=1 Tax=Austropuccinia psidii MF-1 TaxID=1389203 RepID=A0A9Q3CQU2_9BASI|nr:hypothetical protein [Austropuccinia psidii MF-1]